MNSQNEQGISRREKLITSFRAKADAHRTLGDKIADWMTESFGSTPFLILNAIWFAVWIVLNLGLIPGIEPFDPFPFGLLTMIVSLEAIILSIFVLISQNRANKISEFREEMDLQVNILAEEEVTKLMEMLVMLLEKHGIDLSHDDTIQQMLRPTNVEELEEEIEEQVGE